MKKQIIIISILLALIIMPSTLAASTQSNNVRIVEDTIWIATFFVMGVFACYMSKFTKGSNLYKGYLMLLLSSISGVMWKGIGLIKRVFIINDPAWFFTFARETFEGLTGLLFGVAFILLIWVINKK